MSTDRETHAGRRCDARSRNTDRDRGYKRRKGERERKRARDKKTTDELRVTGTRVPVADPRPCICLPSQPSPPLVEPCVTAMPRFLTERETGRFNVLTNFFSRASSATASRRRYSATNSARVIENMQLASSHGNRVDAYGDTEEGIFPEVAQRNDYRVFNDIPMF